MATFETSDFDLPSELFSFECDCPVCGKSIVIPLDHDDHIVCPHCSSTIEIESD